LVSCNYDLDSFHAFSVVLVLVLESQVFSLTSLLVIWLVAGLTSSWTRRTGATRTDGQRHVSADQWNAFTAWPAAPRETPPGDWRRLHIQQWRNHYQRRHWTRFQGHRSLQGHTVGPSARCDPVTDCRSEIPTRI